MTKALLMSCDEEVVASGSDHTRSCDEVRCHHASGVVLGGLLSKFGKGSPLFGPRAPCYCLW